MRAIGYTRVSTEEQAQQGVSLAAQDERIRIYGRLYDAEITRVYSDEGSSGYKLNRRGLQAALAALEDGEAEAIVIAKIDRLSRNLQDFLHLLSKYFFDRYVLLSVGEQLDLRTPTGRFAVTILAAVAQLQLETGRERTKEALGYKRLRCEYTGGHVPYGWRLIEGGKLIQETQEQMTMAHARVLRERGLTMRAIADRLAEAGEYPRTGRRWAPAQIQRLLRDVIPIGG